MRKKDRLATRRKFPKLKRWALNPLYAASAKADAMNQRFPVVGSRTLDGEVESLRAMEKRYHLLQGILQSTSDGILVVNSKNEVLFANERFAEMWLVSQNIIASKDDAPLLQYVFDQLSDPQDFPQRVKELYQSDEESFDTLCFKEGRVFECCSRPMLPEMGVRGRVWSFHEITERKQAEDALQRAEAKYRAIFSEAVEGIFQSTPEGQLLTVNPALAHMWGYDSPEELISSIKDIAGQLYVDASDRDEFVRLMNENGWINGFEYQAKRRDGKMMWVSQNARAVRDHSGTLLYYEGFAADITGRRQMEEELRRAKDDLETVLLKLQQSLERETLLANTDGLTGLCNYRNFFELAAREFQASVRYQYPLAFVMFDLDYFKQINDMLGHAAGDGLLVEVAGTAVSQARASDLVARYGGDEFIIMLSYAGTQQALAVAERIRAGVAAIPVDAFRGDKEPFALTLSMGIVEKRSESAGDNVERLIQRADDALYEAKRSGRNRTVISGSDEAGAT